MVRPLIVVVLFSASALAQIRGVPPSVTSVTTAPDGRPVFRGVPPSVMSLGPEGFGPPLSSSPKFLQPKFSHRGIVPIWFPMFYAVPYVLVERERVIEREVPVEFAREEELSRRRARRITEEDPPLREEEEEDQDQPAARLATPAPEPLREIAPTLLVFRDGSRREVRNFAIVGDALLVFAPDPARKILLAELDLDATSTANEARGIAFVLPE